MVEAFEAREAACGIPDVGLSSDLATITSEVKGVSWILMVNSVKCFENSSSDHLELSELRAHNTQFRTVQTATQRPMTRWL